MTRRAFRQGELFPAAGLEDPVTQAAIAVEQAAARRHRLDPPPALDTLRAAAGIDPAAWPAVAARVRARGRLALEAPPEADTLPPPDRLATAGIVCVTCGADVARGEPHSVACDEAHGASVAPWDGTEADSADE